MGGITAAQLRQDSALIKAGVNIDGGLYGDALDADIQTPFLFINSERYLGYGPLFTSTCAKDAYSASMSNTDHYNFTDYALYPAGWARLGSIEAAKPLQLMNELVLAFFNKYLKGWHADLEAITKTYPEAEFSFRESLQD